MRTRSSVATSLQRRTDAYLRTIHRTNVTGMATRHDYELAFAAIGAETRQSLCGWVPFLVALRDARIDCEGPGTVGLYPPGEDLPPELRAFLQEIDEVVEASGTQVLHMREGGGARSQQFSVAGRQERGILMVALGDAEGSKVREVAWSSSEEGWKVSSHAVRQSRRYGLSRPQYEALHASDLKVLPGAESKKLHTLTAGRRPGSLTTESGDKPWITFAELAPLVNTTARSRSRSIPVKSGQSRARPSGSAGQSFRRGPEHGQSP
jgi:hypothetical protein